MGLFDGGQASATTSSSVSPWAQPYIGSLLERGAALANRPYASYDQPRIAGFSPLQLQSQQAAAGMQVSPQTVQASNYANMLAQRGMGLGQTYSPQYAPTLYAQAPQLQQFQMQSPERVSATPLTAPTMSAAQTNYMPNLTQYQMGSPERVSADTFTQPGTAGNYMSPYMQNVVDIQQREAQRQADIAGTQRNAQAVQRGAFGGSRAGLLDAEAARNLALQKGDIQATGQQQAFQNAQQQFNAEQNARMQAALANQGAGITAGGQNLAALLGVQQLGAQTGLQSTLANLNNQQQASVQNLAASLQAQGMNATQALQAALANQQMGYNTGAQNLSANLGVQQLGAGQNLQAQQYNQAAQQAANQLAANQQQFGAGLGLQGMNLGMQGANLLNTLGQSQYGQNMGINALQQQTGATQQGLRQQGLSQAYQDFLNQRAYPQQQLGMLQSLMTGAPLGTQSTQTATPASPSGIQSLGALGMGAYGLSQLFPGMGSGISNFFGFKDGGAVKNYDQGGVTGPYNEARIVSKLSDPQLQQSMQLAQARNDAQQLDAIKDELAMRASERGGLAGAYNQLPAPVRAASGGIVSFQEGGFNGMMAPAVAGRSKNDQEAEDLRTALENEQDEAPETFDEMLARLAEQEGGPTNADFRSMFMRSIMETNKQDPYKARTADERQADIQKYFTSLQGMAGDNKAKEFLEKNIAESDKDRATSMREGKGLAALAAMEGLVSSPNWIQGLGAAGGRFAGAYGDVLKQDKAEKRALASMQFNLMDAERKEKMGLTRDSIALNQEAEKDYRAAQKAKSDKRFALVTAISKGAPAFKVPTPPRPVRATQPNNANVQLDNLIADIKEQNPDWSPAKVRAAATREQLKLRSGLPAAEVRSATADKDRDARRLTESEKALANETLLRSKWNSTWVAKYGSDAAAREAYKRAYAKLNPEGTEGRIPTLEDATTAAPAAPSAPTVRTQNW